MTIPLSCPDHHASDHLDQIADHADHELRVDLLVEQLGFTPDEAIAYLNGDQSALSAVASRRLRAAESLMLLEDGGTDARGAPG